jgi:predicted transcriptional regulator
LKEKILTTPSVLQAISNKESLELFNVIAEGKNSYQVVEVGMMTRKQYYPRLAKLVQLDLVRKVGKRYELTIFGSIIYEVQLTLAMAVNGRCNLNTLDSFETIQTSDGFTIKNC